MSDKHTPPLYAASTTDTPLDLTVRRPDMDNNTSMGGYFTPYHEQNINYVPFAQPEPEYRGSYRHSPSESLYAQSNGFGDEQCPPFSNSMSQTPSYITLSSPDSQTGSYIAQPSPHSSGSNSPCSFPPGGMYDSNGEIESLSSFDSSILPKKRKNLWRPYDSKLAALSQVDRDVDTGSDTSSGSSSDQEFKTPSMPSDPIKKRKMYMMLYEHDSAAKCQLQSAAPSVDNQADQQTKGATSPNKEVGVSVRGLLNNTEISVQNELTRSQSKVDKLSVATSITNNDDSREKIIAGMKKRDIFGWSLKLMNNHSDSGTESKEAKDGAGESAGNHVCSDGGKTYIELQTVRKESPKKLHENSIITVSKAEPSIIAKDKQESHKSPGGLKRDSPNKGENSKSKASSVGKDSRNIVGKKVYIQRRDNIIESFDETNNVSPKTSEVNKGLSLIDLVEEIEADARRKNEEDEEEKANNKNKSITALLEQCNHVKLQALDFLMSHVWIQEKEPRYKRRNETVQKMLKGDKIGSVNMLDVVELQVEMGLS